MAVVDRDPGCAEDDRAREKRLRCLEDVDEPSSQVRLVSESYQVDRQQTYGDGHRKVGTDGPALCKGQADQSQRPDICAGGTKPLQAQPLSPVDDQQRAKPKQ